MRCEARHGRILLHDEGDGSVTHLFLDQFKHRVRALADIFQQAAYGKERGKDDDRVLLDGLPLEEWMRFFEDSANLVVQAMTQVPLDDVTTRKQRRKKTMGVCMDVDK